MQLLHTSEELWALCCENSPSTVLVESFAQELLAAGYLVQVRDECNSQTKDTRSCLQKLKHRFIVCIGVMNAEGHQELYFKEPIIVDPRFKEQFLIAQPTKRFQLLLQVCFST